jgi:hypothetical protein
MNTAVLPSAAEIAADAQPLDPMWSVVVMFGSHRIAEWVGPESAKPAIEAGFTRRFQSLRIISRRIPDVELAAAAGVEWK